MRLSVVIPAYNEGSHIERIVRDIEQELIKVESDFEIIVVDNGSTDTTQDVLKKLEREIPHLKVRRVFPNQGYGGGILAGLSVAQGNILGWTDGDGQINPADLKEMYAKIRSSGTIFLKARRIKRHDNLLRAMQSSIFNLIFKLLFGTLVHDVNAKPKLFQRSFYEGMVLDSTDFFIDTEVVIKALRLHVPIEEYPITFLSRKVGKSKIHISAGLEFIKNLFYYKFFR